MKNIDVEKFVKERDEMLLKCDVNELRKFINEHKDCYESFFIKATNAASDEVLEVSLHKMIANNTNLPSDYIENSIEWLLERGYSPDF